jgi:hypothetical protein
VTIRAAILRSSPMKRAKSASRSGAASTPPSQYQDFDAITQ